nr:MAG TPA: bacteriocin [Caudoviricetes sp.]
MATGTLTNTSTDMSAWSKYAGSPEGMVSGISGGAQGLGNILSTIGAYNTAKRNYTITVNNAQELIDQTDQQVEDLRKQWYLQDSANQVFMAKSGLKAESFIDAQRDNLLETEGTIVDMRAYARKQARMMIEEAKRAKRKAKKAKVGALLGTAVGTVGGALIGGPVGAGIGAGLGSSLGATGAQI